MNRHFLTLVLTAAAAGICGTVGSAAAQVTPGAHAGPGTVVPVNVTRPAYPAIAVSARVQGTVEVNIGVRPDGRVDSAAIVRAAPLLDEVALEAARSSTFECRGCTDASTPYSLVFAFELESGAQTPAGDPPPDVISTTPSQSRVRIVAEMPTLIADFVYITVRSPKCLYLWQCGSEWGGHHVFSDRARSAACLWLWKCGWRPR